MASADENCAEVFQGVLGSDGVHRLGNLFTANTLGVDRQRNRGAAGRVAGDSNAADGNGRVDVQNVGVGMAGQDASDQGGCTGGAKKRFHGGDLSKIRHERLPSQAAGRSDVREVGWSLA